MEMKNYFKGALALAVALSVASCKDKDEIPENMPGGSGTMHEFTSSESKQFLEETAKEAMGLLNPADQEDFLELSSYFIEEYGDYELPENFYGEDDDDYYYAKKFFADMAKAVKNGDGAGMTRAMAEYVYSFDYDNLKGIYEPNYRREEWTYVGSSNDIIFRFDNAKSQQCELKVSGNSKYNSGSFEVVDDWYDYSEIYNYRFPTEVNFTLTENGTQLASGKVNSDFSIDGHTLNLDVTATVANISANAKVNGTDTKVSESTTTTVGGKTFLTTWASVTGHHLCDINYFDRLSSSDEASILAQLFETGEATATLIDKVSVDATVNYTYDMYDAFEMYAYSQREAEKYTNVLNSGTTAIVRYNNTKTKQASLTWDYTANRYGEYQIEPVLVFPDGSSIFFVDYFSNGFTGVESAWNNLVRKYEAVLNRYFN